MFIVVTVAAQARDWSVSKEFRLRHSQTIAGVLNDPVGTPLSGIELELLSTGTIIRQIRTDSQGRYDFGEVPAGKYTIHLQNGGAVLCAPKIQCGKSGCSLKLGLTLNTKSMVNVD
jgi:hypothetical protein